MSGHIDSTRVHFKKLRDGSWGIAGPADKILGRNITTVTKKDGSTVEVGVGAIVFDNENGFVIARTRRRSGGGRRQGNEPCAECGERAGRVLCPDSSGAMGLCCHQCAKYDRYERSYG